MKQLTLRIARRVLLKKLSSSVTVRQNVGPEDKKFEGTEKTDRFDLTRPQVEIYCSRKFLVHLLIKENPTCIFANCVCLACIVVFCVIVVSYVFVAPYGYLLYLMCICCTMCVLLLLL